MKNKVKMYVYIPEYKYLPTNDPLLPGYPVSDGKGRSYSLVREADEGQYDDRLISLINVRFEQPRSEGAYRASFGTLIPKEREEEFLSFIGMNSEELPKSLEEAVVFEVELDGIYDHHVLMRNIHEIYYADKMYRLV